MVEPRFRWTFAEELVPSPVTGAPVGMGAGLTVSDAVPEVPSLQSIDGE